MKFSPLVVFFFNLCFRVWVLVHVLKEDGARPKVKKPAKQPQRPISKRVFLVNINGLGSEFLSLNATPYLKEMAKEYGFAGVVKSPYYETNEGGLMTLLTGRSGYSSPIFWSRPKCFDTLLSYIECKCGLGNITIDVPLGCYFAEENALEKYLLLPRLYQHPNPDSCFYLISFNIDPVLVSNYRAKLFQIDENIRTLSKTVDNIWNDNQTTYIITSARGSPVGNSLSVDSPIVAWGRGIANEKRTWVMRKVDITAMLCVLLGIKFPTGLFGMIPSSVMELPDHLWCYNFIVHLETVLKVVDLKDFALQSFELNELQWKTRLSVIMSALKKQAESKVQYQFNCFVILSLLWSVYMISVTSVGYAKITLDLKRFFALILFISTVLIFSPYEYELKLIFVFLSWMMYHSYEDILQEVKRKGRRYLMIISFIILMIFTVVLLKNEVILPILFAPVIFWPFIDGTVRRLNVLVIVIRSISGVVLTTLLFNRVFGETPNAFLTSLVSILFLINFALLLGIFRQPVDGHVKFLFFLATVTCLHLKLLNDKKSIFMRDAITILLLSSFFASLCFISGTVVQRLLKIFLTFLIPVQFLSIHLESIFYFSAVLHMFTWVFIEYHDANTSILRFSPGIFTVAGGNSVKPEHLCLRKTAFFLTYIYVFYLAIGHYPNLHSYDFYVLPNFIFHYPIFVSYFLAVFKFFLPFFIPTVSFLTIMGLLGKDSEYHVAMFVSVLDALGVLLVLSFSYLNRIFLTDRFPGKFSYVAVQQLASAAIILSYLIGSHLLFVSESFLSRIICWIFRRNSESAVKSTNLAL